MADVKISDLPVATSLSPSDVFPVVQSATTKQAELGLVPVLTGNIIRVDAEKGTAAGVKENWNKSFATISQAIAVATSGDVISVGPGTFTENSGFQVPDGVSLIGSGIDVTIINSTLALSSTHVTVAPGNGSYFSDFTVNNTASNGAAFGAHSGDTAITGLVLVHRVKMLSVSDGFYVNQTGNGIWRFFDCEISLTGTNCDGVFYTADTSTLAEFFDCEITCTSSGGSNRGILQNSSASIRFFGGEIILTNSSGENYCVKANAGTTELWGTRLTATGGTAAELFRGGGALAVNGVARPDGAALTTSGTITYLSRDASLDLDNILSGQQTNSQARTVASNANAVLDDVNISPQTTTVTGTTAITTAKGFNKVSIYKPTYTDSSAVTVSNAATLYIEDAPLAAGSLTITNKYPVWIDNGTVRFDGGLTVGGIGTEAAGTINANSGYRTAGAAPATGNILQSDGVRFANSGIAWPNTGNISGAVPICDGANSYLAKRLGGQVSKTSQTDQTATTETAHLSFTVPANTVTAGTIFRIVAYGNIDNGTTAITFTPRLRWGGTAGIQILATPTIVGTTTAQSGKVWCLDAIINVWSIGASGSASAVVMLDNHTALTTGLPSRDTAATSSNAVIDTTANKDLVLSWTLSATTGTPHVRTNGGFIEIVKP